MIKLRFYIFLSAILFLPLAAYAQERDVPLSPLVPPYAFETVPSQTTGAVFFTLENTGQEALTIAHAEAGGVAARTELHETVFEGDIMQMRKTDGYEIKAGEVLELTPTGKHIMLINLAQPLEAGQGFDLEFTLVDNTTFVLPVKVVKRGATPTEAMAHDGAAHDDAHDHH